MKKIYILLCAMAALAAASCTEKEELAPSFTGEKVTREFSTVLTKTTLHTDGKTVYWEEGNAISIFDGVANNQFVIQGYDNDSPSASATFSGEVDAGATSFYAVYPYAAGNTLAGSTLTATVPAEQNLKVGSFQSGAAVAVAYTTGTTLAFHQATAILGITLADYMDNVESIEFKGNNDEVVAGNVDVTLNSSGEITGVEPSGTSKTVTLKGSFEADKTYYLSFIPRNFSAGLTVTVTYGGGHTAVATSDKTLNTERGMIYPIANFKRVELPVASVAAKTSFAYGQSIDIPVTFENVTSFTTDAFPDGWTVSWVSDHYAVTAPSLAEIQATPQTVDPAGVIKVTISNDKYTGKLEIPVRLKGINSKEEFDAFKDIYGAKEDAPTTSGLDDYLVSDEITLNCDLSFDLDTSGDFQDNAYVLKYLVLPLNGNYRTITGNITSTASVVGLFQGVKADVKNLYIDGTWKSSRTDNTACVATVAARGTYNTAVTLTNVHVKSTAEIGGTTAQANCVGGFIVQLIDGTAKLTFNNCTFDGTIDLHTGRYVGGFVANCTKTYPVDFKNCSFNGTISISASTTTTNTNVGGFIDYPGQGETSNVSFDTCVFGSGASISATGTYETVAGFIGKAGTSAENIVSMTNCQMLGTVNITMTGTNLNRRFGGFIGDNARILEMDNCCFGGKINLNANNYAFTSVAGILGRLTAQNAKTSGNWTHQMRTEVSNLSITPEASIVITNYKSGLYHRIAVNYSGYTTTRTEKKVWLLMDDYDFLNTTTGTLTVNGEAK